MDTANRGSEHEPQSHNDYLWDGSGEPDPEVQKLEALLGTLRYQGPVPDFSAVVLKKRWIFFPRLRLLPALAATAAAVAVIGAVALLVHERKPVAVNGPGWNVSSVTGTPRIGASTISEKVAAGLGVGQVLETDLQSRVSLRAFDVGQIEVDPGTRLRLVAMSEDLERIALERGTIHAYIWAAPGRFVVDTPSALAVDLGCAYTLHVDDSGVGLVRTSRGWVGFKLNGRESFIPAGAACATRPKVGPGTPYFEDAATELRAALQRFDFEDNTAEQRATDLAIVLRKARKRDALTLWHLLSRADEQQRVLVYERLAAFVPPPAGVTRQGVLALDQLMLDRWWSEFGLDDMLVWRHWERSWPDADSVPSK
jgi:hypothetical protein